MSNESNSSLFTILLANTKDIFVSILSYFILEGNKFTVLIAIGMIVSITGGVMFSSKSICDNMITGKAKEKNEIKNSNDINDSNDSEVKKLKVSEVSNETNENNDIDNDK